MGPATTGDRQRRVLVVSSFLGDIPIDEQMFYAFVDLEDDVPLVFVVPSALVADVIRQAQAAWLAAPGRGGHVRRDSNFRRLLPAYNFEVPGFPAGWMDQWRERWDLLHARVGTT